MSCAFSSPHRRVRAVSQFAEMSKTSSSIEEKTTAQCSRPYDSCSTRDLFHHCKLCDVQLAFKGAFVDFSVFDPFYGGTLLRFSSLSSTVFRYLRTRNVIIIIPHLHLIRKPKSRNLRRRCYSIAHLDICSYGGLFICQGLTLRRRSRLYSVPLAPGIKKIL